jgi:High potential iron-sulfur protein
LNSVSIAAGGFLLSAPPARSALAQTKLTHEAAKYQETPKNNQKCSTCVQFIAPASCKIVADPINPNGWCQFYGAKTG